MVSFIPVHYSPFESTRAGGHSRLLAEYVQLVIVFILFCSMKIFHLERGTVCWATSLVGIVLILNVTDISSYVHGFCMRFFHINVDFARYLPTSFA